MADEVELKLEMTAEVADRFAASPLLDGPPQVIQQTATYFDTPDQTVTKAGFALRIRQTGLGRVQTVKSDADGAAGLFVRSEWERPVADDVPIIDNTTPLGALLGDRASAVAPAFEVRIERHAWMVGEGEAEIELILDRGEVVAGDRRSPICEIELELKAGNPAALFALARRIDAEAPARIGVLAKSERGMRLIGQAPTRVKAAPIGLTGDLAAANALRRIVHACVRQFRLNEDLLLANRDADALHQARVALRRLRSALSIFAPLTGDGTAPLRSELRWLASAFGAARDLDVLLARAGNAALHDRIGAAREAAYDALFDLLASRRARVVPFDLAEWATRGGRAGNGVDGGIPARAFAAEALGRLRRKVKRKGRRLARLDDESRHDLRKKAKQLRYASEFFATLFDRKRDRRRAARFIAALESLQNDLGALNDLAATPRILDRLGLAHDPAATKLMPGARKGDLIEAAEGAYADLIDAKKFW